MRYFKRILCAILNRDCPCKKCECKQEDKTMAKETLRKYLNRMLKSKGATLTSEKKKASKYTSISAAKKAGSLYYTDKNGKVMAAVFGSDLKERIKGVKPPSPITVTFLDGPKGGRGDGIKETVKRDSKFLNFGSI